eukprot:scaffold76308_cov63-Phaeocystis_antarctica.AAC.1
MTSSERNQTKVIGEHHSRAALLVLAETTVACTNAYRKHVTAAVCREVPPRLGEEEGFKMLISGQQERINSETLNMALHNPMALRHTSHCSSCRGPMIPNAKAADGPSRRRPVA